MLRLQADRHHDLTGLRTQAICRLHALLCQLTPGGASGRRLAQRAGQILRGIRPLEPVATERKRIAVDLLGDVRRFDSQLVALNERIAEAVLASGSLQRIFAPDSDPLRRGLPPNAGEATPC